MGEITVDVDAEDCLLALDDWQGFIRLALSNAVRQGGDHVRDRAREKLLAKSHPPQTRTPSLPGEAPASISSHLADSIVVDEIDVFEVKVYPSAHYARIQELGGWMQGHPEMRWLEDGRWHRSRGHSLPARPFFLPSVAESEGAIHDYVYDAMLHAQSLVTG